MIEIKITAETPAEALKDLTELTAKLAAGIAPVAEEKPKKSKPAPAEASAKDEAPSWEGKKETPPAPSYTLETIRAAGVAAATAHGKDAVKAVLTSLGVSGMTQLTAEQYPAFMGKLGELDA